MCNRDPGLRIGEIENLGQRPGRDRDQLDPGCAGARQNSRVRVGFAEDRLQFCGAVERLAQQQRAIEEKSVLLRTRTTAPREAP